MAVQNEILISTERLQEMISERKTEFRREAEQKRQDDLKRIRDMKSKIGLDPLQRFPKEIWMMIMDFLDPEDKRNMFQLHELFHDLLDEALVGDILLPQIIGFEVECFWKIYRYKYPLAYFTELRLVSKTMRNAVDRWFENNLITSLRNKGYSYGPLVTRFELLQQRDRRRLREMVAYLNDPLTKNPQRFFTRSLGFNIDPKIVPGFEARGVELNHEWYEETKGNTYAILDQIGSQIWYFSCQVDKAGTLAKNGISMEKIFAILMGWLERMPNLKWLKLRIAPWEKRNQLPDFQSEAIQLKLDSLERVEWNCNVPAIWNVILSASPNIKIFNLLGNESIEDMPISKMKELPLEMFSADKCMKSRQIDVPLLESIVNLSWPLKTLDLDLNTESIPMYTAFKFLGNFPSLEKLSLYSNQKLTIGDEATYLQLPNLLEFKLRFHTKIEEVNDVVVFFLTHQYLLFAKRLNKLEFNFEVKHEDVVALRENLEVYESSSGRISFGSKWPFYEESNVFKIFPWLVSVKVRFHEKYGQWKYGGCTKEYRQRKLLSSRDFGNPAMQE